MSKQPPNLLQRAVAKAEEQVLASVRTRYFPEIWYALENWFQMLRGRRALEVGYGIGLVSEALAKSGWQVTCTDSSLTALSELRERFARSRVRGTFAQSEADKLPFPKDSFDAVVAINALELAANPAEAVREIARVLCPGGRAVIATFNKLSPWGLPAVTRAIRPGEQKRVARCLTKNEFSKALKAAGLQVEDIKERASYLPVGGSVKVPLAGAFVALAWKPAEGKGTQAKTEAAGKPKKNSPPTA